VKEIARQDGVKDAIIVRAKVLQAELTVDALGMNRPIMGDEMDEVSALQVGARNLVTLHQRQKQRAILLGLELERVFPTMNNLVDVSRIVAGFVADIDDHLRTAPADEGREKVRCQM